MSDRLVLILEGIIGKMAADLITLIKRPHETSADPPKESVQQAIDLGEIPSVHTGSWQKLSVSVNGWVAERPINLF